MSKPAPRQASSGLSASAPSNHVANGPHGAQINPAVRTPNAPTAGKTRRLPPVQGVLNRLKTAPLEKVQELVRCRDILQYSYKQQSQIHFAVAERLKVESETTAQPSSFHCHICNKALESEIRLRRHLLTHGPRNYRCNFPGCTWTFIFSRDLERHRQRHGIAIQVFKCGFAGCGRLMNRRDNARHHIRTIHNLGYGEANALVEVIPIDIHTPDQQSESTDNAPTPDVSGSPLQAVASPNITQQSLGSVPSDNGEDQEMKDLVATFLNVDGAGGSNNELSGLDGMYLSTGDEICAPVGGTTSIPNLPQPGAQRSRPQRWIDKAKTFCANRPKPSRYNKSPSRVRQEEHDNRRENSLETGHNLSTASESKWVIVNTGQTTEPQFVTPSKNRESVLYKSQFVESGLRDDPAIDPAIGALMDSPPTRAPPEPPLDSTQLRPPIPKIDLSSNQNQTNLGLSLPKTKMELEVVVQEECSLLTASNPSQISPTVTSNLSKTFQKKLLI
ncbi:hypothetical protein TWF730_001826 [Orbilia blumenaviensis]|uniref:C2H2-type domain-containing protein n=1 Tax=Orbilia blumenaviensis TaxID=1796055 RepID=A0AAV9UCK9_9PEZI